MCGNSSRAVTRATTENRDERVLAEAGATVLRADRDSTVSLTQTNTDFGAVQAGVDAAVKAGDQIALVSGQAIRSNTDLSGKAIDVVSDHSNQALAAVSTFAGDALETTGRQLGIFLDKTRSETSQAVSEAVLPTLIVVGIVSVAAVVFGGGRK